MLRLLSILVIAISCSTLRPGNVFGAESASSPGQASAPEAKTSPATSALPGADGAVAAPVDGATAPADATTAPPSASVPATNAAPPAAARKIRVLFIITADCPRCDEELAKLRRSGGDFEKLQGAGWKIGLGPENHLQIVDRTAVASLADQLGARDYPVVACISDDRIERSFTSGCTTPLDMWTFGWLLKGKDERPAGSIPEKATVDWTGHYPLRGNHWSIDGDWTPSRISLISHLRGPVHGPQIAGRYTVEDWSYEELRSLHDNLHEQEMGGVSYGGGYYGGASSRSSNEFSASKKTLGK